MSETLLVLACAAFPFVNSYLVPYLLEIKFVVNTLGQWEIHDPKSAETAVKFALIFLQFCFVAFLYFFTRHIYYEEAIQGNFPDRVDDKNFDRIFTLIKRGCVFLFVCSFILIASPLLVTNEFKDHVPNSYIRDFAIVFIAIPMIHPLAYIKWAHKRKLQNWENYRTRFERRQ